MHFPLLLALALLPFTHVAAQAQLVGPPAPRASEPEKCEESAPDAEEIVVCGERYDDSEKYRIPAELRDRGQIETRHRSWDAQFRDMQSVERYSSQTVGPGGYLQNSLQRDCEWRAARQQAQGRQTDCTRRMRPDEPTDWQRR